MRTAPRLRRPRRRVPSHSFVSRHRAEVILTLLALTGVALALNVPQLAVSARVALVLQVGSWALAVVVGSAVTVGWMRLLFPERARDGDRETTPSLPAPEPGAEDRDRPVAVGGEAAPASTAEEGPEPSTSGSLRQGAAVHPDSPESAAITDHSATVADLQARIDELQAALDGQAAAHEAAVAEQAAAHEAAVAEQAAAHVAALAEQADAHEAALDGQAAAHEAAFAEQAVAHAAALAEQAMAHEAALAEQAAVHQAALDQAEAHQAALEGQLEALQAAFERQTKALEAALEGQAVVVLAAQRRLAAEADIRSDERLRVHVGLRAIRRLVTEDPDAPALHDVALRMEAVVARLDSPWTAERPVPPLLIEQLVVPERPASRSAAQDAPVMRDAPQESPGTYAPAEAASGDESPNESELARGEVISPPVSLRTDSSAPGTARRRRFWFRGRSREARRPAPFPGSDSPTSP